MSRLKLGKAMQLLPATDLPVVVLSALLVTAAPFLDRMRDCIVAFAAKKPPAGDLPVAASTPWPATW